MSGISCAQNRHGQVYGLAWACLRVPNPQSFYPVIIPLYFSLCASALILSVLDEGGLACCAPLGDLKTLLAPNP